MDGERAIDELSIGDLNAFYQAARKSFDSDDAFKERARQRVVLLQAGDPETIALWQRPRRRIGAPLQARLRAARRSAHARRQPSARASTTTDARRGRRRARGEGLAVESDGALCVFPPGLHRTRRRARFRSSCARATAASAMRPPTWPPFATASTTRRRRASSTSSSTSQRQHFAMVFAVASWPGGWCRRPAPSTSLFGFILGEDGKMYRDACRRAREARRRCSTKRSIAPPAWSQRSGRLLGPSERVGPRRLGHRRHQVRTTSRAIGSRTTSSTGTACWRSTATRHRICSTHARVSAPSFGGARSSPIAIRARRRLSSRPSALSRWSCSATNRPCAPRPRAATRIASAPFCSRLPAPSPRSTTPALCSMPMTRSHGGVGSCSATSRAVPGARTGPARHRCTRGDVNNAHRRATRVVRA